jgi:hypothetical protein
LGGTILLTRIERFRADTGRPSDDWSFSESDLVRHFRGEARALQRYVLDNVRNSITHHSDNKLRDFIEFSGRSGEKPFSYSSIERTFYSFFINKDMLETAWDLKMDVGENPREIEKNQIIRLMKIIADTIYVDHFDPERGTEKIESRIQKGEDVPDEHLRAHRMAKEEILFCWLGYIRDVVKNFYITQGQPITDSRMFQYNFPDVLWNNIQNFVSNVSKLPMWVSHDLSSTIFGGKPNSAFWKTIFETGSSPQGQKILSEPINLIKLIQA